MILQDKVAMITGGAKGIGRSTAELFGQKGAKLIIADVDVDGGNEFVTELKNNNIPALFVKLDVTDSAQVEEAFASALKEFGRIDILVNNAGITIDGFLVKTTDEAWERVIDVNLTGVFNCGRAAAKIMMEQGEGCILNAASVVGLYGNIGQTNYAATKAGVIGMSKSWAKELGPKNVRVNVVAPGFIVTDMTAKVPEKVLEMVEGKTPLKKLGQPEDIAQAYLYLASDAARFVTGAVLSVDGGLVL